MEKNKVITYSLLAHINNNKSIASGLLELFIPLVKRTLSHLNEKGITSGESTNEIKKEFDDLYSFDIPYPVLEKLLKLLSKQVNETEDNAFHLYDDGAFIIKDFVFTEFEELIDKKSSEIKEVESLFSDFLGAYDIPKDEYHSIFDFIEKNKLSISKYLGGHIVNKSNQTNFLIEAHFVEYFKKIPPIYETIRAIYIGSIISTYIEFKTDSVRNDIELVFDTNFLIGLLDLNTPESTHTCKHFLELSKHLGLKLSVLNITIKETQNLLLARAENFDRAFLQRRINKEDIYNACDRRGLTRTDLERFSDNLEKLLTELGVKIIPNTEKYQNKARFSKLYQGLKKVRHSEFAALHDATVIEYVNERRQKKFFQFEKVNCWFVHNSITSNGEDLDKIDNRKPLPEHIKVDDLLNIYWLSNPGISGTTNIKDLSDFGLNSLISSTISDSLPKSRVIRELDKNIGKYISDNTLTENDIIRVATRISNREITDIEQLNKKAEESSIEFIKRLKQESDTQKQLESERAQKFQEVIGRFQKQETELSIKTKKLDSEIQSVKQQIEENEKHVSQSQEQIQIKEVQISKILADKESEKFKRLQLINEQREKERKNFIAKKIWEWRLKTIIPLSICVLLFLGSITYVGFVSNWQFDQIISKLESYHKKFIVSLFFSLGGLLFSPFLMRALYDKYINISMINAFKDSVDIPKDHRYLHELKD